MHSISISISISIYLDWWWYIIFLIYYWIQYARGQQIFFYKRSDVKYFSFVGHMASVATTQLCFCSQRPYIIEWTGLCPNKTSVYKNKWQATFGLWAIFCKPLWCFVNDIYICFHVENFPFLECLCQVLKLVLYWPHKTSSVVFPPLLFSDRICVRLIFLP